MIKNFSFVRKTSLQRWRYFAQSDLCNVSNKIIFKVLRHRLKQVLFDRISETQSAFVLGDRSLTILSFLKRCSMRSEQI